MSFQDVVYTLNKPVELAQLLVYHFGVHTLAVGRKFAFES